MQKKVYLKDLTVEEILDRLENCEKLFVENQNTYYQRVKNSLIIFIEDEPRGLSSDIEFFNTSYPKYFLDEVEEPEADESCIGKLCKFWHYHSFPSQVFGVLIDINNNMEAKYESAESYYEHCQALTKEEALALVKE